MEKKTTSNEDNTKKIVNFSVWTILDLKLPQLYLVVVNTVIGLVGYCHP